ncbi:hypothetical protein F53441_13156 [Fusarium austroafricanum]|uniref:DUF7600 domain-containing protein n=1 Tax=Fusarium austroafricanum TaxID=2364996 RepID=A0A8H4NGH9_9HYPO|nr:hypothetical protein F53441_13156 [Fusarium austroafricanum]
MKFCTLCGIPLTRGLNEPWAEDFRVVWIEGKDWNHATVSGVGRWGHYDDEVHGTVPIDPQNFHSQSEPGPTMDLTLTPLRPAIFTRPDENSTPWACLSMPTGKDTLLDWGHDYGGAASLRYERGIPVRSSHFSQLEDTPKVFRSDPYHIPSLVNAIEGAARLQDDVFLSHWQPNEQSLKRDSFSRLVPEILQLIAILLPTSDIHSLRLASPAFATLKLPEGFWASRFQPGNEWDHLPEVQEHPPKSWRAFYLSLKIWARENPSMANRRRVWGLAKDLQATLKQLEGVPCTGSPLETRFESLSNTSDGDNGHEAEVSWHTAARAVAEPDKDFSHGCRVLRARALFFSEPVNIRQMSVSFVDTVAGRFVSGLSFIDQHSRLHSIGYQHKDTMVHIPFPFEQPIQGWELALDMSGVKGIAVIYNDGTISSWAGEFAGIPRWRLTGTEGISAVKAELDAFKLVTLSRDGLPGQKSWQNTCLWYPEVPRKSLTFNARKAADQPPQVFNFPMTTVFFGESDGRYLPYLSDIVIWVFDICYLAGIEFRFTDSSYNRQIGNIGPFDEHYPAFRNFSDSHDSSVAFPIDGPSGERLSSIEVQTKGPHLVGLKINTSFGRNVQTPEYPYGVEKGWASVYAKGSEIIGMFASSEFLLRDIGFISTNEKNI